MSIDANDVWEAYVAETLNGYSPQGAIAFAADYIQSRAQPQETRHPSAKKEKADKWPPLKKALWNVLMAENLNDGHYIKAFDLIEKLYAAAIPFAAPQPPQQGVRERLQDLRNHIEHYAHDTVALEKIDALLALSRPEYSPTENKGE